MLKRASLCGFNQISIEMKVRKTKKRKNTCLEVQTGGLIYEQSH